MRDGWFALTRDDLYGRAVGNDVVVWSWDYDGATDVLRTRTPSPALVAQGQDWPEVVPTSSLELETPNSYRVGEFWRTLLHASGSTVPSLVMSGSARVVYQTPGKFEQDGLSHVDMQDEGLRRRQYPHHVRVDRNALHLRYNYTKLIAAGFNETSRAKMDIVLRQIRYAQSRLRVKKLLFVFVDDIYASVLADMFVTFPNLAPRGVTVHLVHYESFRDRRIPLTRSREVIPGVLFSPF